MSVVFRRQDDANLGHQVRQLTERLRGATHAAEILVWLIDGPLPFADVVKRRELNRDRSETPETTARRGFASTVHDLAALSERGDGPIQCTDGVLSLRESWRESVEQAAQLTNRWGSSIPLPF